MHRLLALAVVVALSLPGFPAGSAEATETPELTVSISSPSDTINTNQRLRLSGQVTGLSGTNASYVWTSTYFTPEDLVNTAIIACRPAMPLLVIREGLLAPGLVADFTLTVTDNITGAVASDTFTVYVNTPPTGGAIEISPPAGIALETLFTLTAPDWTDTQSPQLYYIFWYRLVGTTDLVALTPLLLSDTAEVYLPEGDLEIVVRVYDVMGAWTTASTFISVYADPATAINSIVADVTDLNLANGISNALDAKLANALKALDDVKENNDISAVNRLQAFINEVQAQEGHKIPTEAAEELITKVQQVINLINQ